MQKKIGAILGGTVLVLWFAGCSLWADGDEENGFIEAEISTVGVDHLSQSPVVLLRTMEGSKAVPIWIGFPEAQAIARALHGVEMPRPLTHDLTVNLLKEGGLAIEEIIVHDMREGVYYGRILLRHKSNDQVSEIDSRPSDALALALRSGATIRVSEKVLVDAPDFDFVPPDVSEQVVQILGMTVVTVTGETRRRFDLEQDDGVVVSAVSGVAAELGVREGDVIVGVNEEEVATPMDVLDEILEVTPGDEAEIRILRNGDEESIRLPVEGDESPVETEPGVTI